MICAAFALLVAIQPEPIQPNRLDMASRLIALDKAWMQRGVTPAAKRQAVPLLSRAVTSFFGGQFGVACEALDQARLVIEPGQRNPLARLGARIVPGIVDSQSKPAVSYGWLYGDTLALTPSFQPIEERDRAGIRVKQGEHSLEWTAPRFDTFGSRHAALKESKVPEARALAVVLQEMQSGVYEGTVSAASVLREAEQLNTGRLAPRGLRDVTLDVYDGVRIRASVPRRPKAVVVALHGAGGNENMFFESYGAGVCVRLAADRDWVFIAPRTSGKAVKASLAWLKARYDLSDLPLFVMGHSMGGGVAAQSGNARPKGVALFAPALNAVPDGLRETPVFHAVGESEIAMLSSQNRRISQQLADRRNSVSKVYPNCEHLMIVAEAAEDAFKFFDKIEK